LGRNFEPNQNAIGDKDAKENLGDFGDVEEDDAKGALVHPQNLTFSQPHR
jgi:hypothetical protein